MSDQFMLFDPMGVPNREVHIIVQGSQIDCPAPGITNVQKAIQDPVGSCNFEAHPVPPAKACTDLESDGLDACKKSEATTTESDSEPN